MRQSENQNDDGAGTRPQADRDDGRQAALPPVAAAEFGGLRRVGVAPGVAFVMIVIMRMVMRMAVRVMMCVVMRMTV